MPDDIECERNDRFLSLSCNNEAFDRLAQLLIAESGSQDKVGDDAGALRYIEIVAPARMAEEKKGPPALHLIEWGCLLALIALAAICLTAMGIGFMTIGGFL